MEKFTASPEDLFGQTQSVAREILTGIKQTGVRYLNRTLPAECVMEKGGYYLTEDGNEILKLMGNYIGELSRYPDALRLPNSKVEREELTKKIIDFIINPQSSLFFLTPVCPDYKSQTASSNRLIGQEISNEAKAGIRTNKIIKKIFPDGRCPALILIADTEFDNLEIIENCANGDKDYYLDQCRLSVQKIQDKIKESCVEVSTFTEYFGNNFHNRQHDYQARINHERRENFKLQQLLTIISKARTEKHAEILGRPEKGEELSIRYMAQYAALGSLMREISPNAIAINYSSPNREFYNLARNTGIQLIQEDALIIPVLGSIL